MNIYKNPAFPNGAAVFQSTSKLVPFCSYLGLIFAFSHNPVLWRNAGPGQLCVLSRPSCVDLTRQSQTCWRQPPDVIHSPRRALWALAAGPPPPPSSRPAEEKRGATGARRAHWLSDTVTQAEWKALSPAHCSLLQMHSGEMKTHFFPNTHWTCVMRKEQHDSMKMNINQHRGWAQWLHRFISPLINHSQSAANPGNSVGGR